MDLRWKDLEKLRNIDRGDVLEQFGLQERTPVSDFFTRPGRSRRRRGVDRRSRQDRCGDARSAERDNPQAHTPGRPSVRAAMGMESGAPSTRTS
jgi:hypothetical protein